MRQVDALLDDVYAGQERITSAELERRAVVAQLPASVLVALHALPEGEYSQDEVSDALHLIGEEGHDQVRGIPGGQLTDQDLLRELAELHRTRTDTLRHGSDQALARHDSRMAELEQEYLRRFPDREVDPHRLRPGTRTDGDGGEDA